MITEGKNFKNLSFVPFFCLIKNRGSVTLIFQKTKQLWDKIFSSMFFGFHGDLKFHNFGEFWVEFSKCNLPFGTS